jgi:hypothetical protein
MVGAALGWLPRASTLLAEESGPNPPASRWRALLFMGGRVCSRFQRRQGERRFRPYQHARLLNGRLKLAKTNPLEHV